MNPNESYIITDERALELEIKLLEFMRDKAKNNPSEDATTKSLQGLSALWPGWGEEEVLAHSITFCVLCEAALRKKIAQGNIYQTLSRCRYCLLNEVDNWRDTVNSLKCCDFVIKNGYDLAIDVCNKILDKIRKEQNAAPDAGSSLA